MLFLEALPTKPLQARVTICTCDGCLHTVAAAVVIVVIVVVVVVVVAVVVVVDSALGLI